MFHQRADPATLTKEYSANGQIPQHFLPLNIPPMGTPHYTYDGTFRQRADPTDKGMFHQRAGPATLTTEYSANEQTPPTTQCSENGQAPQHLQKNIPPTGRSRNTFYGVNQYYMPVSLSLAAITTQA